MNIMVIVSGASLHFEELKKMLASSATFNKAKINEPAIDEATNCPKCCNLYCGD